MLYCWTEMIPTLRSTLAIPLLQSAQRHKLDVRLIRAGGIEDEVGLKQTLEPVAIEDSARPCRRGTWTRHRSIV